MARKGHKELNPPTTFLGKCAQRIVDWVEDRISANSIHGDPPVYDTAKFPWVEDIEKDWQTIRSELDTVLKRRDELPAFHEITSEVKTISTDQRWKTYVFHGYGLSCNENLAACPNTAQVLKKIPGIKTAFFSILDPGKHIPAHRGPYNGVLRYHLGLIIPKQSEQCRIRIDKQNCTWAEGRSLIFDDSYDHEVWNDTNEQRVVLFVDFVRPTRWYVHLLNCILLSLAVFAPFVKEAKVNTRAWTQRFYRNRHNRTTTYRPTTDYQNNESATQPTTSRGAVGAR